MALTPRSGSLPTTSTSGTDIPNSQTDIIHNLPNVKDSELNKFAIDTKGYPNASKILLGFLKGHRISVTYYRQQRQGGSNVRTNTADYPTARNVLANEYQKIIGFEITLPKAFDFEVNPDLANVGLTGEAHLYPNSDPNVGDIFTMGVGDGRIGVFQVSYVAPMSWQSKTAWVVRFVLQSFMDSSDIEPIEGAVTQVSFFSKENYLGGVAALLSEDTYLYLNRIRVLRGVLVRYFHQTFFDSELYSYLRPDGLYDGAVVRFMSHKLSLADIHTRPKNLTGKTSTQEKLYNTTIWARLSDRYNTTLFGLAPMFRVMSYKQSRMGSFVTELVGKNLVEPSAAGPLGQPYVFGEAFYAGTYEVMSDFEKIVYMVITKRQAPELGLLVNSYLETVYDLDPIDQFYRIPIYLHLIDLSVQTQYREIDAPGMGYASQGE